MYLAHDNQLDREVALKRMKVPEDGNIEALAADLIREAKTLSVLQHPNIVTVYDVGKDEKGPFLVLELLKGETLDEVIERGGMTLDDFKQVVMQTLEGLIAAQAVGLVHRDLKPGNLMVVWLASGKFQIKILDFGLAKFGMKARPQTEDQGGGIFGSIFFMAPEQFERLPLDARTDMYSLGCIYYQILTTKHPFEGETGVEVMASHLQHHVKPLQTVRPDLPDWLCHWVMWLISREMEDRPTDARTALEYFMAQRHKLKGIVPKPTGLVAATAPPQQRKAPPGVLLPGQRPVPRPPAVGATTGKIVPGQAATAVSPEGTAASARSSTRAMQRVPKKKSNAGLWITLSLLILGLVGGLAYLFTASNEPTPIAQTDPAPVKAPDPKPVSNPPKTVEAPKPVPSPPKPKSPAPAPNNNNSLLASLTSNLPSESEAAVNTILKNGDTKKREGQLISMLAAANPQQKGRIVSLAGLNDMVTSSGLLTSLLTSNDPPVKEQFYSVFTTWPPKLSIAQKLVEMAKDGQDQERELGTALNMVLRSGNDAAAKLNVLKMADELAKSPAVQNDFSAALATIPLKEAQDLADKRKDSKAATAIKAAMGKIKTLGTTPLKLTANDAIIISGTEKELIDPKLGVISNWKARDSRLAWDVECKDKASVSIQVEHANAGPKAGRFRINFGNYGRTFTVKTTGSATTFALTEAESIEIPKSDSGRYRVVIEPVDIPSGQELMTLKSVILTRK